MAWPSSSAILEVLGAVGLFAFAPVVLASVLAAILARRWASLRSASVGPSRPILTRADVLLTGLAVLAAAAVIAEWGALTIQSYDVGIRGFDSLWYHLPWAASFAQTGNIVSLRFTDVEYLTSFYPATAEVLHGLGIVLLGRDTLSPGLNLVWLALTFLAAYCVGRPRGVGAGDAARRGGRDGDLGDGLLAGRRRGQRRRRGVLPAGCRGVPDQRGGRVRIIRRLDPRRSRGRAGRRRQTHRARAGGLGLTIGVVAIAPRGDDCAPPGCGSGR